MTAVFFSPPRSRGPARYLMEKYWIWCVVAIVHKPVKSFGEGFWKAVVTFTQQHWSWLLAWIYFHPFALKSACFWVCKHKPTIKKCYQEALRMLDLFKLLRRVQFLFLFYFDRERSKLFLFHLSVMFLPLDLCHAWDRQPTCELLLLLTSKISKPIIYGCIHEQRRLCPLPS